MKNCGSSIIKLCDELSDVYNSLYNRIFYMSATEYEEKCTREWLGLSAKFFSQKVIDDKKQIVEINKELKDIGNVLIENALLYEEKIKQIVGDNK